MAKAYLKVLERAEAENKKRAKWEEENPPITRISVGEADQQRTLQTVGQDGVTCDLHCHGNYIPQEYDHTRGMVNVFKRGIVVEGWEKPQEGYPAYFGLICALTLRRICVAKDETLRKAVER